MRAIFKLCLIMITSEEISTHLQHFTKPRDPFFNSSHHFFANSYIKEAMTPYGEIETQPFEFQQMSLENIILHLPCKYPERPSIIIGAHYDTVPECPGVDDNGSGVAVLLALAKALGDRIYDSPIRLVAFDMEEYLLMGSEYYSQTLKVRQEQVQVMISLEMLGYITDQKNSQKYPGGLKYFYPNQGNFIALIGNLKSIGSMNQICGHIKRAGAPCEWLPVPLKGKPLPAVRRSDHAPFWDAGYPAMMMTDTADFRNPHYHQTTDTLETVNIEFMTQIANGLVTAIATMAKAN